MRVNNNPFDTKAGKEVADNLASFTANIVNRKEVLLYITLISDNGIRANRLDRDMLSFLKESKEAVDFGGFDIDFSKEIIYKKINIKDSTLSKELLQEVYKHKPPLFFVLDKKENAIFVKYNDIQGIVNLIVNYKRELNEPK